MASVSRITVLVVLAAAALAVAHGAPLPGLAPQGRPLPPTAARVATAATQPNPPVWPPTVSVFHPGDANISAVVNAAFAMNGGHTPPNHGQFSSARCVAWCRRRFSNRVCHACATHPD